MLGGYKFEAIMIAVVIIMLGQMLDQSTSGLDEQPSVEKIEIPRA